MSVHHRTISWAATALLLTTAVVLAEAPSPEDILKDKGLLLRGSSLYTLRSELELDKRLSDRRPKGEICELHEKLLQVNQRLRRSQEQLHRIEVAVGDWSRERQQIGADLERMNARPVPVDQRNRAVIAYNSATDRINQAHRDYQSIRKEIERLRDTVGKAREEYFQALLKTRELVEGIHARYEDLGEDPEVQAALDRLNGNRDTSKRITVGPSRPFLRNVKKLEKLEKTVFTETIELERRGNLFWIDAIFGEEHNVQMVVDTGASLVTLPADVADKIGLKPTAGDRSIRLILADGKEVQARLSRLESLRIGKFKAEDVACAVMPSHLRGAIPLLGQSFLGRFTCKVDPDKKTLTIRNLKLPEAEDKDKSDDGRRRGRPTRRR